MYRVCAKNRLCWYDCIMRREATILGKKMLDLKKKKYENLKVQTEGCLQRIKNCIKADLKKDLQEKG